MDSKFELIEAEFGLTGFGVVVKLLQEIYGKQGYYIEWTNEVALLFAKRIGLGGGVVSQIVEASIRRGMFNKDLYDKYQVLTSSGIQKRYFEAVSRRKEISVDDSILLVNCDIFPTNVDIKRVYVNILSKNADIFEQSKVKKSKEEKSKEEYPRASAFDLFWKAYPKKVGKAAAERAFDKVKVSRQVLLDAVERQKHSAQWERDNGQFIPNPATWLNQGRWDDEVRTDKIPTIPRETKADVADGERMKKLLEKMRAQNES